jgi:serine/threonine-protein kinase
VNTDKLVLNHKATIVPAHEALNASSDQDGDYILVMSESRNPPRSVPRELALLLLTLRKPATVIEAVITVSRVEGGKPKEILERFYQSLPQLIEQHYLEYAQDAELSTAVSNDQESTPAGFELLRVLNRLEDTEVLLVRQGKRVVVIKRARIEFSHITQRLAWEAQILEQLNGSVAPRLLSAKLDDPHPYLVLQAIPGLSLWDVHRSRLAERWEFDVFQIGKNILRSYRNLHEQGLIHSDIHPRNILVDIDGNVKLIDFEYAGRQPQIEHAKAVGITPYFAPEVAAAVLETRATYNTVSTDQYSVAAVITWLLTSQYHIDFVPDAHRALEQIIDGQLRANAIEEPQGSVLKRALAVKPEDRFASMSEFESRWSTSQAVPTTPNLSKPHQTFKRWARKMWPGGTLWSTLPQAPHASLYFGLAGSVWALVEGSTVLDWDEGLHNALPWLYRLDTISSTVDAFVAPARNLRAQDSKPYRLYHDRCGIDLLKILVDHRLGVENSSASITGYTKALSSGDNGPTELTDGVSGYLYGCVLLKLMGKSDSIDSSANHAAAIIEQRIQEKLQSESLGYLGMAHGLAGECYSLMSWSLVNHQPPPDVVSKILGLLEKRSIPIGFGYEMPIIDGLRDTNGASWCHGAGGYIYLWRIAARLFHEPRFIEQAERFAQTVWSTDWNVHQLCCGSIGGAFAVAGLASELGDSRWERRAQAMIANALCRVDDTQDPVSLFKGQVGGLLLEAQVESEKPLIFPLCGEVLA